MHQIHEFRLFGTDLVDRLNNGTGHLDSFFANATEATLRGFIEQRMALVEGTITDCLIFLEMQPQPIVALEHLTTASHVHRGIRESLQPLLRIREAASELTFQIGAQVSHFLGAWSEDHLAVWNYIDDLLITSADRLEKGRKCVSRLKAQKDARLREAIIAIHEIRVALSTMFCEHEEADHAYIAALELLTGAKQPAPVPSKLLEESMAALKVGPKTKTPSPTVH